MFWALLIFLLYYFIFYTHYDTKVPKPGGPEYIFSSHPVKPIKFTLDHDSINNSFEIHVQNHLQSFKFDLPDTYTLQNNSIVKIDPCHGLPDGFKVSATSRDLYEYVKKRDFVDHRSETMLQRVNRVLRKGQIFYFECKGGHVQSLHVCDGGTVMYGNSCIPIDDCIDKEIAVSFADRLLRDNFFQCNPRSQRKKCPAGTYFVQDSCRRFKAIDEKCENNSVGFFALDHNTYIRCDKDGHAMKYHCPPEHRLFGEKCELEWCVNRVDGTKIPLPEERYENIFSYSPGYAECNQNRVIRQVRCGAWNKILSTVSPEEDLTMLPMVFDGMNCTPPSLCENVKLLDPDKTVVPTREYSSVLGGNWDRVHLFDASVGFGCDKRGFKRKYASQEGQHIKRFRFESACDDASTSLVVIGNEVNRYYDCTSQSTHDCPKDHFFNGKTCQKNIARAHKFRGIDVFRLDNLSPEDGWMRAWNYSNDPSPFKKPPNSLQCIEPESKYINGYNICAHPDCSPFGFLKQLDTYIILNDGHLCYQYDGKIIKTPKQVLKSGYQFWSQRGTIKTDTKDDGIPTVKATEDPCRYGQKIRSGNFVMDSVIFTTCDAAQPFVFCPAAKPSTIEAVIGSDGNKVYACQPPNPGYEYLEKGKTRIFQKNELERVDALDHDALLVIDSDIHALKKYESFHNNGNPVKITTDADLRLVYKYAVTYPLNAYFEGPILKAGKSSESFILKRADLSEKPMLLPNYKIEESVDGFSMYSKTK